MADVYPIPSFLVWRFFTVTVREHTPAAHLVHFPWSGSQVSIHSPCGAIPYIYMDHLLLLAQRAQIARLAVPEDFFEKSSHLRGLAKYGTGSSLCTEKTGSRSHPQEWLACENLEEKIAHFPP
jgi:hypothetical protein